MTFNYSTASPNDVQIRIFLHCLAHFPCFPFRPPCFPSLPAVWLETTTKSFNSGGRWQFDDGQFPVPNIDTMFKGHVSRFPGDVVDPINPPQLVGGDWNMNFIFQLGIILILTDFHSYFSEG